MTLRDNFAMTKSSLKVKFDCMKSCQEVITMGHLEDFAAAGANLLGDETNKFQLALGQSVWKWKEWNYINHLVGPERDRKYFWL